MKMKNLNLILIGCLAAASLWAADVSGKWTYEMTGRNGNTMTSNLTLKADGDKLTGSVSGRNGDTDISDGKVDGDNVSFTVVREFNGNKMTQSYKGKLDGDTIHFAVSMQGGPGGGRAREFDAHRAQ